MTNNEAIDLLDNLLGVIEDNHGSDYDKAIHMAIDALKGQQWIPMSKREPDPGNYLTTFRKRGDPEDKRDVAIDLYWSGGWDDDGIDGDGTVFETLAWMTLPEPYKEEEP